MSLGRTSLDKSKIKVLLLEGVHQSAVDAFKDDGYNNIEYHPKALPPKELTKSIRGAYLIGIRSNTQLSEQILNEAHRLIAVGCFCIGTNQVALDVLLRFFRTAANVRREDHIVEFTQRRDELLVEALRFIGKYVDCGAGEMLASERID